MASKGKKKREFISYTNDKMYEDISKMYEEVKNPPDELTKKLLDDASVAWEESDRLGISDKKADPCVNHFIQKYPLLAQNCPFIFKVCLLKERYINLNLVSNALSLERAMNETKKITRDQAEVAFGKQLAQEYFPEEVYNEVKEQMKDPEKVAALRKYAEEASKKDAKTVKME